MALLNLQPPSPPPTPLSCGETSWQSPNSYKSLCPETRSLFSQHLWEWKAFVTISCSALPRFRELFQDSVLCWATSIQEKHFKSTFKILYYVEGRPSFSSVSLSLSLSVWLSVPIRRKAVWVAPRFLNILFTTSVSISDVKVPARLSCIPYCLFAFASLLVSASSLQVFSVGPADVVGCSGVQVSCNPFHCVRFKACRHMRVTMLFLFTNDQEAFSTLQLSWLHFLSLMNG